MKKKVVLIVALACGLVAALLTRVYISSCENETSSLRDRLLSKYEKDRAELIAKYDTISVLAFKKDTPRGAVLSKSELGTIDVPALGLRGHALKLENFNDVVGRKLLSDRNRGEILFWNDVEGGDLRRRALSESVKTKMRAMSVNVSGSASVSGMVRPNDHVDVIGTFGFPDAAGKQGKGEVVTCTILQNVLVLATGGDTADALLGRGKERQGFSTVTLEVTPREAEMLAFTEQLKGSLVLTLRNRNDTSFEKELPKVDFEKIRSEIEELNLKRQQTKVGGR